MTTYPIPNCVQVDLRMQQDGQNVQNSMYYQLLSPPDVATLESMAAAAETAFTTDWAPQISDQVALHEIVLTDLSGLTGPRVVYAVNPAQSGTDVSPALPSNATISIKRSGSVRGRGMAGRLFWIGLTEAMVTNNLLAEANAVDIIGALETFDTALVAAAGTGAHACIPHKTGAHHGTTTQLTDWSVSDLNIDSQRDRLPKHKRHKRRVSP